MMTARFRWGRRQLYESGHLYADRINTVSPSYAAEIQTKEFGCGLDDILRMCSFKLSGILNGIDYETNDPEKDPVIPYNFSVKNLAGKKRTKRLCKEIRPSGQA